MDFNTIKVIFGRKYNDLREASGENAPNSYTWFAPTITELREECDGLPQDARAGDGDSEGVATAAVEAEADRLGTGEPVAYVYECEGQTLTAVCAGATEEEIADLFWTCFGFEETAEFE